MAIYTISNAGGNWDADSAWVGGVSPVTASDTNGDIVATPTSGNLTLNGNFACNSINLTGYVATLIHNAGAGMSMTGSLILSALMTYTIGNSSTSKLIFVPNVSNVNITTNGITIPRLDLGATLGSGTLSYNLQDNLTCINRITLRSGILNTNNKTITASIFTNGASAGTATLNLGTSTVNLSNNSQPWIITPANFTLNPGTSTINFTDTIAEKTLSFGGVPLYNVRFAGGASNQIDIGNDGFGLILLHNLIIDAPNIIQIAAGMTLSFGNNIITNGSLGNLVTFQSDNSGTPWNITKSSGAIATDFISLTDSNASGGAKFYAGADSTDNGGNSGWLFINMPIGSGFLLMGVGS